MFFFSCIPRAHQKLNCLCFTVRNLMALTSLCLPVGSGCLRDQRQCTPAGPGQPTSTSSLLCQNLPAPAFNQLSQSPAIFACQPNPDVCTCILAAAMPFHTVVCKSHQYSHICNGMGCPAASPACPATCAPCLAARRHALLSAAMPCCHALPLAYSSPTNQLLQTSLPVQPWLCS